MLCVLSNVENKELAPYYQRRVKFSLEPSPVSLELNEHGRVEETVNREWKYWVLVLILFLPVNITWLLSASAFSSTKCGQDWISLEPWASEKLPSGGKWERGWLGGTPSPSTLEQLCLYILYLFGFHMKFTLGKKKSVSKKFKNYWIRRAQMLFLA